MVPYRGMNCLPLQDDELKGKRTKNVSQIRQPQLGVGYVDCLTVALFTGLDMNNL